MGVTLGEIREVHREFPIVSGLAANIFHFFVFPVQLFPVAMAG